MIGSCAWNCHASACERNEAPSSFQYARCVSHSIAQRRLPRGSSPNSVGTDGLPPFNIQQVSRREVCSSRSQTEGGSHSNDDNEVLKNYHLVSEAARENFDQKRSRLRLQIPKRSTSARRNRGCRAPANHETTWSVAFISVSLCTVLFSNALPTTAKKGSSSHHRMLPLLQP